MPDHSNGAGPDGQPKILGADLLHRQLVFGHQRLLALLPFVSSLAVPGLAEWSLLDVQDVLTTTKKRATIAA